MPEKFSEKLQMLLSLRGMLCSLSGRAVFGYTEVVS